MVLAQPGQLALVSFITTESVRIGTPINLAILVDEAYPYYNNPIPDILKNWTEDPPGLPQSKSILGQRFYLTEINDTTAMRHCQVQVNFHADTVQNELLAMTVYGGYIQEL